MAKLYATLDNVTLGAQQELQQGGLVLTFDTNATNLNRNARGTMQISGSRWYWECAAFGNEALSGTNLAVGLVQPATANNVAVGASANTVAYYPGNGNIVTAGSVVATVAPAQKQQIIAFAFDLVAGTPTLDLYVNKLKLYTWNLTAGLTWLPAASIGGTTAYGLFLYFNMGRRALENTPPANFKPGIFSNPQTGGSIFVSSEHYRLPPTGSPANQRYEKRIKNAKDFYIGQKIQFWTDGQSSSSASAADLDLYNGDSKFSPLVAAQPRDALVTYALVDLDDPTLTPTTIGTLAVDRIVEVDAETIRIIHKSPLERFKIPLQRKIIPPWAADGAANQVYPISLGACRNVAPVLVDSINRVYLAHDEALTAIGIVRDKGDPLDPTASPPDYTASGDLRGIALQTNPDGKLLMDLSSQGASHLTPVSGSDLISGAGAMTTATSGVPTGWTQVGIGSAYGTPSWVATDGGRMRITFNTFTGSGFETQTNCMSTPVAASTITAGHRYRITIDVKAAAATLPAGHTANIGFIINDSTGPRADNVPGHSIAVGVASDLGFGVGSFTFDFVAPFEVRYLVALANLTRETSEPSPGSYWVEYDNITIVQLPDPPDPSVPLVGISLGDYMQQIIEARAGYDSSAWVRADADAIDAATPFAFGVSIKQPVSQLAALEAPMDSFTGALTTDELGRIRVVQEIDPATVADADLAFQFKRNVSVQSIPICVGDEAKGLTKNAGVRHNWEISGDSDFVNDYDPVTGIDAATRTRFKRDSQYIVTAAVNLDPMYSFADGADPVKWLFDVPANGDVLINGVNSKYSTGRVSASWTGFFSGMPPLIRCGSVVSMLWDDPRRPTNLFYTTKKVLVKEYKLFPFGGRIDILDGWF